MVKLFRVSENSMALSCQTLNHRHKHTHKQYEVTQFSWATFKSVMLTCLTTRVDNEQTFFSWNVLSVENNTVGFASPPGTKRGFLLVRRNLPSHPYSCLNPVNRTWCCKLPLPAL